MADAETIRNCSVIFFKCHLMNFVCSSVSVTRRDIVSVTVLVFCAPPKPATISTKDEVPEMSPLFRGHKSVAAENRAMGSTQAEAGASPQLKVLAGSQASRVNSIKPSRFGQAIFRTVDCC